MKKNLTIRVIKIFLNILLVILGIMFLQIVSCLVMGILYSGIKSILSLEVFISSIIYLIYFLIIYNLRKIVYSTDSTPFCLENVKRFKMIGYSMFIIAIFNEIIKFKRAGSLEILASKYGLITSGFIIFIVLACIALVLAEIFKKAVEIKNENDLTI